MSSMPVSTLFEPRLARRRFYGKVFVVICAVLSLVGLLVLGTLLVDVVGDGWSMLSWKFLTNFPSVLSPEDAGIKSALWGSLWLITVTALVAVPVGVGAAIYLEEYATQNRFTRFVRLNIANLAGVPSIVYGILGLAVFVRFFRLDRSVLAGGLTMALLVLPVIIIASREALVAVPRSLREAAYSLGATRWQVVWHHVLPSAVPGIMTGVILAISRAMGEAAPLIMIGALTYVAFVPDGPLSYFTVMPIQIYNWCDQPLAVFHQLAASGIMVLLGVLIPMNAVAIAIRGWQQRKKLW